MIIQILLMILLLEYKMKQAENIDISKLYNDIYVEKSNAYYTEEPFKIYPEVNGIDFAVSTEEIETILNTENENNEYTIPLKIETPEITFENLSINAFPNVLAKADSTYDVTNYNRANNLNIASEKINIYIIAPGETFHITKF